MRVRVAVAGLGASVIALTGIAAMHTPVLAKGLPGATLSRVAGEDPSVPQNARNGGAAASGDVADVVAPDGTSTVRFVLKDMDPTRFPAGSTCTNTLTAGSITLTNVPLANEKLSHSKPNVAATAIDVSVPGSEPVGANARIDVTCGSHSTSWAGTFK
jgi:hypothetical protein